MTDEFYMRRAIELAKKGRGWTNPNPMVGAVIVKNGSIIGEVYHEKCGELHAERNAIASLTESAEGATIYVTLEKFFGKHIYLETYVKVDKDWRSSKRELDNFGYNPE